MISFDSYRLQYGFSLEMRQFHFRFSTNPEFWSYFYLCWNVFTIPMAIQFRRMPLWSSPPSCQILFEITLNTSKNWICWVIWRELWRRKKILKIDNWGINLWNVQVNLVTRLTIYKINHTLKTKTKVTKYTFRMLNSVNNTHWRNQI